MGHLALVAGLPRLQPLQLIDPPLVTKDASRHHRVGARPPGQAGAHLLLQRGHDRGLHRGRIGGAGVAGGKGGGQEQGHRQADGGGGVAAQIAADPLSQLPQLLARPADVVRLTSAHVSEHTDSGLVEHEGDSIFLGA